jgi:hypothetical protein
MRQIVLHVDELRLRGVRRQDRLAIANSLCRELTQALAAPDAVVRLSGRGAVDRLHVPTVHIADATSPAHLGQAVARGIGRELRS